MNDERRIEVCNWNKFQHYKDRDPPWIKNYTRLLADHNYLSLTLRQRGILHGLWLLYAASGRDLGHSPAQIGSMLGQERVRTRDLERLEQAGFIRTFASARALARSREEKNVVKGFERTLSRALGNHDDEELFEHDEEQIEELERWPR